MSSSLHTNQRVDSGSKVSIPNLQFRSLRNSALVEESLLICCNFEIDNGSVKPIDRHSWRYDGEALFEKRAYRWMYGF